MAKQSSFLTVHWKDFVKGFFISFLTAFLTTVVQMLQDGSIPTLGEFRGAGIAGLTAGLAYVIKNWLTNSNDQLLKKEQ
jgi:hypothetical protein